MWRSRKGRFMPESRLWSQGIELNSCCFRASTTSSFPPKSGDLMTEARVALVCLDVFGLLVAEITSATVAKTAKKTSSMISGMDEPRGPENQKRGPSVHLHDVLEEIVSKMNSRDL